MSEVPEITQINRDMEQLNAPFSEDDLPEKAVLQHIEKGDELTFLSYGVSLDYNRNAKQLWENCLELYQRDSSLFQPSYVIRQDLDDLKDTFEDIRFRFHQRDAQGWYDNSQILVDNFDGSWWRFLKAADFDAPRAERMLNDYNFKFIKGVKLAPFWLKVVDANIVSLERVEELDIPVDVHIRRLTKDLAGMHLEDDEIRDFWKRYAKAHDINMMAIDTGLWLIGNNWNDWGEDYWEQL